MRIAKFLIAAATSAALVVTPAVAAPKNTSNAFQGAERALAASDANSDLFRTRGRKRRGGGILAIIVIAVIIAIGIYIYTDDDDNESPASP